MDDNLIERLRGLLAKATPGTWRYLVSSVYEGQIRAIQPGGVIDQHITDAPPPNQPDDMELICAAVNALPELLAHIERLEREAVWLQDGLANYADHESDCAAETDSDHDTPCNCGFWRFNDALAAAEKRAHERWIKGDKTDG